MANSYLFQFQKSFEPELCTVDGYFALDGSSNVLPLAPTAAPGPVSGTPYTLAKGVSKSIGAGASATTQPHTTTGTYVITLDSAWDALVGVSVTAGWNPSGAKVLVPHVVLANVTATTGKGNRPGTDPNGTAQTLTILWADGTTSGSLADPPANTGFWFRLKLKNTATYR